MATPLSGACQCSAGWLGFPRFGYGHPEDLTRNKSLEAAQDLSFGLAFLGSLLGIRFGVWVPAQPRQSNPKQRAFRLAIPAPI